MRLLMIGWGVLLTVAVLVLLAATFRPSLHDVRASDVTVDEVSGLCYRLRWVAGTDRYAGGPVSTDGVECPYGVGRNR